MTSAPETLPVESDIPLKSKHGMQKESTIQLCAVEQPLMLVQPDMDETTIASSNEFFREFELWIRLRMLAQVHKLVTFRQCLDFLRKIGLHGASRNKIANVK